MSTPFGQLVKFAEQMTGAGVVDIQDMLDSGYFALLRKAVVARLKLPSREEFARFLGLSSLYPELTTLLEIVIPDNCTIETLASQVSGPSKYITDTYFKVTVHGPRRLFLARFNKITSTKQVKAAAEDMGYEVALIEDLLCVGARPQYRELQWRFPIIALGSFTTVNGSRRPPCLHERHIGLCGGWMEDCRFLFVSKEKTSDI